MLQSHSHCICVVINPKYVIIGRKALNPQIKLIFNSFMLVNSGRIYENIVTTVFKYC